MDAEKWIRIRKPKVFNDSILRFDVGYSKQIKKYLSSDEFYLEYEEDVGGLDPSILCIPAVSGIIAVAWAVGADVYVEALDQTYLKSLSEIKTAMMQLFPDFSFSTQIKVGNVVSNSFSNDGSGLLFTGGIDSVTSYIKHKQERPDLIKVWGAEVPFDDQKNWRKAYKMITDFTGREGARLHVIRTNIPRVLRKHVLYREFGLDWWLDVNHGFVLTGLCAPLTCTLGIGTLYFASGDPRLDWRSRLWYSLLNQMAWAGIKVVLDNYELSRQLKIRYFLKDYLGDHSPIFLKVCNVLPVANCGKCEKCLRTITGLVVEGIDPNKCGFKNVDDRIFDIIKERFTKKTLLGRKWIVERRSDLEDRIAILFFWKDVQKHMPELTDNNLQGSEEFLEWFRSFDITEYMQNVQETPRMPLRYFLYMLMLRISIRLPKSTQKAIKRLLDFSVKHTLS
jgi:hypothetical protein